MRLQRAERTVRRVDTGRDADGARLRLELVGDSDLFDAVPDMLRAMGKRKRDAGEFQSLGRHESVYLKGGRLRGRSSLRHGLRHWLLRRSVPRLAEFETLKAWRGAGFAAARPLLGAVAWRRGLPIAQLLATEHVERAGGFRALLEDRAAADRRPLLELLGRTVGTLHARGFVHGDLYPRNLLYRQGRRREIVFLDARRGAGKESLRSERGPARDLGCFFLHAAGWLSDVEQRGFLDAYVEGRGAGHAPARTELLARRSAAAWAFERRRFLASPARHRDLPQPESSWSPPFEGLPG